jgi:predicted transcriptional regulator
MSPSTPKEIITVRVAPRKQALLDKLARATDGSRSYIVNAAIDAYIDAHAWQFATDVEVAAAYNRWR